MDYLEKLAKQKGGALVFGLKKILPDIIESLLVSKIKANWMQTITNNPYRITGLLVGATAREQDRQIKRLLQYIEAEQEPEDDFSFATLGNLKRTVESVNEAASKLNLDNDKLNAAIFWFFKNNEITDEPAFDALRDSDIQTAVNIWSKLTNSNEITLRNFSAYQNLSTLLLCKSLNGVSINESLFVEALSLKMKFLESDFVKDFKSKATDETYKTTKKEIQLSFLISLQQEIEKHECISSFKFIEILSNLDFTAKEVFIDTFINNHIEKIEIFLNNCKKHRKEIKKDVIVAATNLYNETQPLIALVKKVIGSSNLKFTSISDKVSEEILQCGIQLFNDFKGHKTYDPGEPAMKLFQKANSLAQGSIVKQRCQENTENLQDWIDEKPERDKQSKIKEDLDFLVEVFKEYDLKSETIENAKSLIVKCKPSLENIKSALGRTDDLYIKLSTRVAIQAQSILVEVVNKSQTETSTLYYTLSNAWLVTILIGTLDMETDFKTNSYNKNKETLKNICSRFGINTSSTTTTTTTQSQSRISSSQSQTVSNSNTNKPLSSSTNTNTASNSSWINENPGCLIMIIVGLVIGALAIFHNLNADEKAFNRINTKWASTYDYEKFIRDYPNSKYITKAYDEMLNIAENKSIIYLNEFANKYYHLKQGEIAKQKVSVLSYQLYENALKTNTIEGWEEYKLKVPTSEHKDANKRIERIEKIKWGTDSKAWAQASSLNTIDAFNKYLKLYPNGIRKRQAEKKIIDIQVANVFAGDHGQLPTMDKTKYGYGNNSTITIKNSTSYTLTLLYSGNDSKRLVISPYATSSVKLPNGKYRIAASVDASNVRSFAGTEDLTGGQYDVEYYIKTSSY